MLAFTNKYPYATIKYFIAIPILIPILFFSQGALKGKKRPFKKRDKKYTSIRDRTENVRVEVPSFTIKLY